jgi:hypothetical protein
MPTTSSTSVNPRWDEAQHDPSRFSTQQLRLPGQFEGAAMIVERGVRPRSARYWKPASWCRRCARPDRVLRIGGASEDRAVRS